jgi:glyoxylase-like metal-dependent hydrolase (beta-lactamase superfamily II)
MTLRLFLFRAFPAACLLLALGPAAGHPASAARGSVDVVFATSVESPLQARKARLLVESLRRFGGPWADAPVHVVVDDVPGQAPATWNRPGVTVHALEGDAALRQFPYARKVLAAAQVERLVGASARTLVWLDAETLVLSPPEALVLRGEAVLAVRPVFLRNAVALPEGAPLDAWWSRIAREAGLDAAFHETVAPLVDPGRIRWYVNCGVYSVRPSRGLLGEWARTFAALAADPVIRKEAGPGGLRHVFLHQAAFGAVVLARTAAAERSWLPNETGYPLHLHERVPPGSRLARLDDAQVVIHEDLFELRPDWHGLVPATPALAAFVDEGIDELFRVADGLWREEGSCNSYLVRTGTGSVVVDPAGAAREGSFLRRLAARWPVEAILLTHGHDDHRLGAAAFQEGRAVPVVAQREIVRQVETRALLAPFFAPRDAAQSGRPPSTRAIEPVDATVLFADGYVLESGGVTFRLTRVGGETPDTSLIWVPGKKALFVGDDFYDSFPMLSPPRGSAPRPALEYVGALEKALELEPELLLPGHGDPVVGAAEVRRRLVAYRDAIRHVHDAVVAGMNAGKDLHTLMNEVRLPEGSEVREFYGNVRWGVRGIWAEYAGSYGTDPAELLGRSPGAVLPDLVSLAGAEAVATRAREALAAGDALRALQLADAVLAADPAHGEAVATRSEALSVLRGQSRNFAERNWLDAARRRRAPPRDGAGE